MILLQYYYYLKSETEIIFKNIGFSNDTQLTNINSWYAKASNISIKSIFLVSFVCFSQKQPLSHVTTGINKTEKDPKRL